MGYNTVAVIMNDATSAIGYDAAFGASVRHAMLSFDRSGERTHEHDVPARGDRVVHCNAMRLISCEHSSAWQVLIVGHNSGWHLGDDRRGEPPPEAVAEVVRTLQRLGYKVTKPKPPRPSTSHGGRS